MLRYMQIITKTSKLLILVLLTCSILIVWDGGSKNVAILSPLLTIQTVTSQQTPPVSIWSSLRNEFKIDHKTQSAQVQAEIRKLLADEGRLYDILKAAGPYIYFIHKQTQARGLPAEIALIPVIESEFNPNDRSSKGATGLWQLMSGTAHELGVKVMPGYDGRRNVVASTKAALTYFNDLANNFKGNWYLAIAAYNCGPGCVASAARRAGSQNFWDLHVPKETQYYVPRLLAVAAIVNNPEKYGIVLPPILDKPYFTEVKVSSTVNLERVAANSGVNIKTLKKLNPDIKQQMVPKKGADTLLIPVDKAPIIKAQLTLKEQVVA